MLMTTSKKPAAKAGKEPASDKSAKVERTVAAAAPAPAPKKGEEPKRKAK
jgi:hypothetical protein